MKSFDFLLVFVDVIAADDHEVGNVQNRHDAVDVVEFLLLNADTEDDEVADLNVVVCHDVLDDVCFEPSLP